MICLTRSDLFFNTRLSLYTVQNLHNYFSFDSEKSKNLCSLGEEIMIGLWDHPASNLVQNCWLLIQCPLQANLLIGSSPLIYFIILVLGPYPIPSCSWSLLLTVHSEDYIGCWEPNPSQPHSRQMSYLLYYSFYPDFLQLFNEVSYSCFI